MRTMAIGVILTAMAAMLPAQNTAIAVGPTDLQVDNLTVPLGIDDPAPRFSWQLHDPSRGAMQTAYRITVASRADRLLADKPDVWDSGRVESAQSLGVPYGGPALKPSTRYYWHIELWGVAGQGISRHAHRLVGNRPAESGCAGRRSGSATKRPKKPRCATRRRPGSPVPKRNAWARKRPRAALCLPHDRHAG